MLSAPQAGATTSRSVPAAEATRPAIRPRVLTDHHRMRSDRRRQYRFQSLDPVSPPSKGAYRFGVGVLNAGRARSERLDRPDDGSAKHEGEAPAPLDDL